MNIDELKQSKVWDARYDLPIFPLLNNPFLLGAYVWLLLGKPSDMQAAFFVHATKCYRLETHTYVRWPDGSGGRTSQDELIGLAYLHQLQAKYIIDTLDENDGIYNFEDKEYDTMYRFIFLEPFLRQCAGMKVSLLNQLKYITHIAISAITWKKESGASGALMIWLMNDKMQELPLCSIFIKFYYIIVEKKGATLKYLINDYFPQEEYAVVRGLA